VLQAVKRPFSELPLRVAPRNIEAFYRGCFCRTAVVLKDALLWITCGSKTLPVSVLDLLTPAFPEQFDQDP